MAGLLVIRDKSPNCQVQLTCSRSTSRTLEHKITILEVSKQDRDVMEKCANKHIKDGEIANRRRAKPRMRLCLNDALIVARRYITILSHEHSAQHWTFDAFLNRLLTTYFLLATGAYTGDLGIPTGVDKNTIKAESLALQICEIDLHLAHSIRSLENFVLTINLTCLKGNK